MRNRKVSRPAPARPALPKNVRVATKRAAASDRFTVWLFVAVLAGCAATAPVYVRLFLTDALRFEAVVLWVALVGFAAACASVKAFAAWDDLFAADAKLTRRGKTRTELRSRLH